MCAKCASCLISTYTAWKNLSGPRIFNIYLLFSSLGVSIHVKSVQEETVEPIALEFISPRGAIWTCAQVRATPAGKGPRGSACQPSPVLLPLAQDAAKWLVGAREYFSVGLAGRKAPRWSTLVLKPAGVKSTRALLWSKKVRSRILVFTSTILLKCKWIYSLV